MSYVLLHEFDPTDWGGFYGRAVHHFWYTATEDMPFPDAAKVAEKLGLVVGLDDELTLFHIDSTKVHEFKAEDVGQENPMSEAEGTSALIDRSVVPPEYADYVRPDGMSRR